MLDTLTTSDRNCLSAVKQFTRFRLPKEEFSIRTPVVQEVSAPPKPSWMPVFSPGVIITDKVFTDVTCFLVTPDGRHP